MKLLMLFYLLIASSIPFNCIYADAAWKEAENTSKLRIEDIFKDSRGILYAGTHEDLLYKSTDQGKTWTQSSDGIVSALGKINCFFESGDTIFTTSGTPLGGNLCFSSNAGISWDTLPFHSGATDILVDGQTILASTGSFYFLYFRSTDLGKNWSLKTNDWSMYRYKYSIHGDSYFAIENAYGLVSSSDKGGSWEVLGPAGMLYTDYIVFDKTYIVAGNKGIFISNDGGLNWFEANSDGIINDFKRIGILTITENGRIYAASDTTVYTAELVNGMIQPWESITREGMPELWSLMRITSLIRTKDNLVIGTADLSDFDATGRGVYYLELSSSNINENLVSEEKFEIFPNPAFDHIRIGGGSISAGLEIYDIRGNLIISIAPNDLSDNIDISGLVQGGYLVRNGIRTSYFIKSE